MFKQVGFRFLIILFSMTLSIFLFINFITWSSSDLIINSNQYFGFSSFLKAFEYNQSVFRLDYFNNLSMVGLSYLRKGLSFGLNELFNWAQTNDTSNLGNVFLHTFLSVLNIVTAPINVFVGLLILLATALYYINFFISTLYMCISGMFNINLPDSALLNVNIVNPLVSAFGVQGVII